MKIHAITFFTMTFIAAFTQNVLPCGFEIENNTFTEYTFLCKNYNRTTQALIAKQLGNYPQERLFNLSQKVESTNDISIELKERMRSIPSYFIARKTWYSCDTITLDEIPSILNMMTTSMTEHGLHHEAKALSSLYFIQRINKHCCTVIDLENDATFDSMGKKSIIDEDILLSIEKHFRNKSKPKYIFLNDKFDILFAM